MSRRTVQLFHVSPALSRYSEMEIEMPTTKQRNSWKRRPNSGTRGNVNRVVCRLSPRPFARANRIILLQPQTTQTSTAHLHKHTTHVCTPSTWHASIARHAASSHCCLRLCHLNQPRLRLARPPQRIRPTHTMQRRATAASASVVQHATPMKIHRCRLVSQQRWCP